MNKLQRKWLILVLLAALPLIGAAQNEKRYAELPNFHQINEHLFRGGQPHRGGMMILSGMGIKTIINLCGEGETSSSEEAEAKSSGLRYFNVPMSSWGRPSDEQVERVMALIDDQRNWPVMVHCRRGSDRTGAIIAVYRIQHEGWTAGQAITEAKKYGLAGIQFRKKEYISDYYERQKGAMSTAAGKQR